MNKEEAQRLLKVLKQGIPLSVSMFTLQYIQEGYSPEAAKKKAADQVAEMLGNLARVFAEGPPPIEPE